MMLENGGCLAPLSFRSLPSLRYRAQSTIYSLTSFTLIRLVHAIHTLSVPFSAPFPSLLTAFPIPRSPFFRGKNSASTTSAPSNPKQQTPASPKHYSSGRCLFPAFPNSKLPRLPALQTPTSSRTPKQPEENQEQQTKSLLKFRRNTTSVTSSWRKKKTCKSM
jgi:hypothetical protein